MNEQLNYYLYRYQTAPLRIKFLLLLIINALIVYYFYDTSIQSTKAKHKVLFNQKKNKIAELNSLRELKAKFPQLQKEIDDLTLDLQQKLRKLPNDSEIPSLLKTISKEASKAGLKITLFTPKEEVPSGYFYKLPISLEAEGTYHQMTLFCDKISKLPRIINILNTHLSILKDDVGRNILKATFDVHAFRFKERVPDMTASSSSLKKDFKLEDNPVTKLFEKLKKTEKDLDKDKK